MARLSPSPRERLSSGGNYLSHKALDEESSTILLARAFDLAWERYYTAGQREAVPKDVARRELAAFLVEMLRSGVTEEEPLAACGVLHLIAITADHR
jgi:hypothetical protein